MNRLEQILEFAPRIEQKNNYATIDVYAAGTVALYSGPEEIIPSNRNYGQYVIPYGNQTELGGDAPIHLEQIDTIIYMEGILLLTSPDMINYI